MLLGEGFLSQMAREFVGTPTRHWGIEHFQGPAAGVDLVIMGEIGESFEDPEQLLIRRRWPHTRNSRRRRSTASSARVRDLQRWLVRPRRKKALGELASRRQALARQNAELDKLKEQRRQLVEDEKRLRDNLASVGHDTALYKQTLDKLGETETTIGTLSSAIAKGTAEIETAKEQLQDFVSTLTL